ncbi:cytochrome P450 monooxygenase-like protein [Periconia macrospinosa]|uniref:Cytochrome P450 monooxygenase-like protein n=1 Tax=Periconia macrospinosa TaxID=97972 RepID=A0A2V1D303_9PLEO|nr:cytochrome P450 monooxygenase-like protein [Periconia macrospinosa]
MTIPLSFGSPVSFLNFDQLPILIVCFLSIIIGSAALNYNRKSDLPHANPPSTFGLRITKQNEFYKDGMDIITSAKKRFAGKPYKMLTTLGEVLVLPPKYGGIIHNNPALNFRKAVTTDFPPHVSGFEPFAFVDRPDEMLQNMVKKHLTKLLNTVTAPLSEEATFAVDHVLGSSPDWQTASLSKAISSIVARLSSRVFLGEEICRNEEWLKTTTQYATHAFMVGVESSTIPSLLRPIVSRFSQRGKTVRAEVQRAREIIAPVIAKRRAMKEQARINNEPIPQFNDALEWAEMEFNGKPYDPSALQLFLSFAAIHTTTDLACETMLRLANDPSQITALREEMIDVLSKEGWKKTSLYNLKLLDSAIKEAQRVRPTNKINSVQLRRLVVKDVVLEGGVKIRKGERAQVDMSPMWDPSVYPNPDTYDMYRFLRMREQSGGAQKAQLVTTSPDFLPFGHGTNACPGRFFASNEIKLALCHLLLKYDWRLAPGTTTEPLISGQFMTVNPKSKLQYRRRKEEIDLESLDFH